MCKKAILLLLLLGLFPDTVFGADILAPGDFIIAIDADGNSASPAAEAVEEAIDGITAGSGAKYLNSGRENSGFIVTPQLGSSIVTSFDIWTANDVEARDPASWELYGTNEPIVSANHSTGTAENWTLIASGPLSLPSERNVLGPLVTFANSTAYASYKMIFPTVKDAASTTQMQIAEIQFYGIAKMARDPEPADGEMAPSASRTRKYVVLDYTPGDDAVTHTGYFSDNFDDVNDRVASANLGTPPYPGNMPTAYFVGYDDPVIKEFARAELVRGTTYYWAIDENDGTDTYPGHLWSFTLMPDGTYDPLPPDGAGYVLADPNATVSWSLGDVVPGSNSVSYDVYYGTDKAAVEAATVPNLNVEDLTAEIGPLDPGTIYYWRSDVKLSQAGPPWKIEIFEGDTWQFQTLPLLTITDPNLEGWWKLDEGYGATTTDWSGNGRHGTLQGDPQWAIGYLGNCLDFDGSGDYVNIDGYKGVLATNEIQHEFTVAAWIKTTTNAEIITWGNNSGRQRLSFRVDTVIRIEHGSGNIRGTNGSDLRDDEWHHVAATIVRGGTISAGDVLLYVDGQDVTPGTSDPDTFNLTGTADVSIGRRATNNDRYFNGLIDDARIYDKVLTQGEIQHIIDPEKAWDLSPADGAMDVPLGTPLTWKPGIDPGTESDFTQHDVYFSTSFEDVNSESIAPVTISGATTYAPTLEYYARYYWKVNEVGTTTVKGNIQTFKAIYDASNVVDPRLRAWYKLDGDTLDSSGYGRDGAATGSEVYAPGYDGQAFSFDGSTYVEAADYAGVTGTASRTVTAWIKTTTYGEVMSWGVDSAGRKWIFRVQESNGTLGAIRVEVNGGYTVGSTDLRDNAWHHVAAVLVDDGSPDVQEIQLYVDGALETPSASLDEPINTAEAGSVVRIGKAPWGNRWFNGLIDDARIYDVALSVAEIVKIMRINLAQAWNPNPADGATGVGMAPTLTWNPGDYAPVTSGHYVYFGADDPANMALVTNPAQPQSPNSYAPGDLDLDTTFYWAVDEANTSGGVDAGRVWSFTTTNNLLVDDMETYTYWQTADNNIFEVWVDGMGNCKGSGNGTGANVFESLTTGVGGSQAMEFNYDNDGMVVNPCLDPPEEQSRELYYSKAEAEVGNLPSGVGSNWTAGGAKALSLMFQGMIGNALEPMWIKLTDTSDNSFKVLYGTGPGENAADIAEMEWFEWNIDLADFTGVDVTSVKSIAIGLGNEGSATPGGAGTLYFDEIRLYTPRCVLDRRSADYALVDYAPENTGGDCIVNNLELEIMTRDWLQSDRNIDPVEPNAAELVVWYKFEDDANDSSGNGINGVENGFPFYTAGKIGQAISLDGVDDFVDIDNANIVTGNMTIALWMQPRNMPYTTDYRSIFHNNNWNAGSIHGHLRANTSLFNFEVHTGKNISSTTAAVSDQWYHVVATIDFDNGEAKIYVDGVLENTTTSGGTATPYLGPLNIGAWQEGSRFFDGLMDDFRVYDYVLNENEVVAARGLGTIYVPVSSPANLSDDEPATQKKVNFLDYARLIMSWLEEQEWPRP